MSSGGTTPAYRASDLLAFATALFRRAGLDPDKAGTVAEVLLEGDLLGHTTYGLALAAPCLAALDAGRTIRDGEPTVVSDRGGALCWDGRRLPGPSLVVRAIEQALARVPAHGIAAVAMRESHHIGCLASYLERATSKGCMIPLTCSDPSEASVAPYGGLQALFTPDPIAVGIPTDGDPILRVDHDRWHGRAAPEGGQAFSRSLGDDGQWRADRRPGPAVRRAARHVAAGRRARARAQRLQPGPDHRGAQPGARGPRPRRSATAWRAAVYLQITDPAAFGGGDGFVRQTGFIAAACRRNPPVPGVEAVRLPGEQALARRLQARAAGVRLYPGIMEARAPWAERFDVVAPARAH